VYHYFTEHGDIAFFACIVSPYIHHTSLHTRLF